MLRCPKHPCHEPSPDETILINAGEETSKVLIHQNEVCVDGCRFENGEECVDITRSKVVWTRHWDQLEDHSGKNAEDGTKRRVHEGDDWSATPKIFLPFCQNVASW